MCMWWWCCCCSCPSPPCDPDHDLFRESVRRFYEEEVVPFHDEWEKQGHCPPELWRKAGENGLLCVTMPEEYGAAGIA